MGKAGAGVVLAHGFTYTDQHKLDLERLFGAADLALLPKRTILTEADLSSNRRNFFPYFERHFEAAGESEEWRRMRRTRRRER